MATSHVCLRRNRGTLLLRLSFWYAEEVELGKVQHGFYAL